MSRSRAFIYFGAALVFGFLPAHAEQFQELGSLTGSLSSLAQHVSQSTFGFQTTHANSLRCTGFFIGQNGEALTNLHCVEECLAASQATQEELAYPKPVFVDSTNSLNRQFLRKKLVAIDSNHPVVCHGNIYFNEIESDSDIEIHHVFGPGFLFPRTLVPDLTRLDLSARNALLGLGFEGSGDLVLIKVSTPPKGSSCLKIGTGKFPTEVPKLLGVSYTQVHRETGDAKNPFATIGADGWKRPIASIGEGTSSNEVLRLDDILYASLLPAGTVLTSTDAERGASGSPLVNENGEVVAVVRGTYNRTFTQFKAWTTHAIDLSYHSEALKEMQKSFGQCP